MTIDLLKQILQSTSDTPGRMSWDAWAGEQSARAQKVQRFRDYADGNHDAKMTDVMRKMLRLDPRQENSPFNINHMDNIIQTMVDRLKLTDMAAETDAGTKWMQEQWDNNRLDGLQLGLHEAGLRDADTYIMVQFDNAEQEVVFTHEEAYDGVSGILMVYGDDDKTPKVAIKVWRESVTENNQLQDTVRVNLYYPDRIEKYVAKSSGQRLEKYEVPGEAWPAPWRMRDGTPIGIPIIHFPNKGVKYTQYGKSELDDATPMQDAVNRTAVSMIMNAELTGFSINTAVGTKFPEAVTPGMAISVYTKDAAGNPSIPSKETETEWLKAIKFDRLEQAQIAPFIQQAEFFIEQMYFITGTPSPKQMGGDNSSGESLKQRELRLLGKVERAQVSFGNAWENVFRMAHRVQTVFSRTMPPVVKKFYAKWRKAEMRSNVEVVDNAIKIKDLVDERTVLEALAEVFGWDSAKIDAILEAKRGDAASRLVKTMQRAGTIPTFNGFSLEDPTPDGIPDEAAATPA